MSKALYGKEAQKTYVDSWLTYLSALDTLKFACDPEEWQKVEQGRRLLEEAIYSLSMKVLDLGITIKDDGKDKSSETE